MSTAQIAQTIAGLIQQQGEQAAQARAATGAIWGGALRDTGATIANAIRPNPEVQLAQQKVAEGQRQAADLKSLDTAFSQPGGRDRILASVPGHLRPQIAASFTAADESAAKLQSAQIDAEKASSDYVTTLAEHVKAHDYDPTAMQLALSHAKQTFASNPSILGQLGPMEAALQANPTADTVKSVIDPIIKAHDAQTTPVKLAGAARPGGAPETLVNPATGEVKATGASAGPAPPTEAGLALQAAGGDPTIAMHLLKPVANAKPGTVEDWVSRARRLAIAKNGNQPLTDQQAQAVDSAAIQQFKETNADPELRAANLAQKNIAEALAKIKEGQQPTAEDAKTVADDLVNHRQSPSQVKLMFGTRGVEGQQFMLKVNTAAKALDPNFNYEEAESGYQLAKSTGFQNTVRYMDSALESIPRLEQNAKNLGNGSFRTLTQIANAAKNQFNDTDLKRFKTDALLVGDEVAKILSGGGTGSATSDAKLKQATDIIGTSDSVPAIAAAMQEVQALMGNRRRALTRGTYMERTGSASADSAPPPSPTALTPGLRGLTNR